MLTFAGDPAAEGEMAALDLERILQYAVLNVIRGSG